MNELTQLRAQLTKLANARTDRQRAAIERSVLLWGVRLYRWTQETAALLEEQLTWLDANTSAPSYEKRFLEWEQLLRGYEQASRLLDEAKAMAVMAA